MEAHLSSQSDDVVFAVSRDLWERGGEQQKEVQVRIEDVERFVDMLIDFGHEVRGKWHRIQRAWAAHSGDGNDAGWGLRARRHRWQKGARARGQYGTALQGLGCSMIASPRGGC